MPRMGPDVGHAIGHRLAMGRRVTLRVIRTLSAAQLVALRTALAARGKRLPEIFWRELAKR
jgi:hypothetical protein